MKDTFIQRRASYAIEGKQLSDYDLIDKPSYSPAFYIQEQVKREVCHVSPFRFMCTRAVINEFYKVKDWS